MANLNSNQQFGPFRWNMSTEEVQGIMAKYPGGRLIGAVQKMKDGKPTGMWDLSKAKVVAKTYALPENLKNRSFEEEDDYRRNFQKFVDAIWLEKQQTIKDLKL